MTNFLWGLECKILQELYCFVLIRIETQNNNEWLSLMFSVHIFDWIMEQIIIQSWHISIGVL